MDADVLAKTSKIQYEVKRNCEEMRDGIKNIYDWTKEMKEKEKKLKESVEEYGSVAPIRSQGESGTPIESKSMLKSSTGDSSRNIEADSSAKLDSSVLLQSFENNIVTGIDNQKKGNTFKQKGNEMFKLEKYDEAIEYYTNAIQYFDTDSTFFTNRAICYLRQERYDQCIEDCNNAILIDKKNVKAYYRRMQAFEGLGKNDKALMDCKTVLKMDSRNFEARKSLDRINQRFRKLTKNMSIDKPTFTNLTKNMDVISEYHKPAHLRSNKPLKRIGIVETIGSKDDKNYENSYISNETISDEVIDKLFNNNNIRYTEIKKPQNKIQDKAAIHDMNADSNTSLNEDKIDNENIENEKQDDQTIEVDVENEKQVDQTNEIEPDEKIQNYIEMDKPRVDESENKNLIKEFENKIKNIKKILSSDLPIPTSPAQFHTAWKEFGSDEKFSYFKNIQPGNLNRILGSGLEPDLLTDIFLILKDYYVKSDMSVHEILTAISQHDEFSILSLFLSEDDREVLNGMVVYMKNKGVKDSIIEKIKHDYYLNENED